MGYRLSKIYTRTGDDGYTNLGDNNRIPKDHPRLTLMGTLDELNSAIGLLLAQQPTDKTIITLLTRIQHELFNVGGELCPPHHQVITTDNVSSLEKIIDDWNSTLPPLKEFILTGGNIHSATCHLARTICRRAERCAVTLHQQEPINPEILRYLNRLSDMLFVAARVLTQEANVKEVLWEHERK